jgi:hypothetical protein
LFAGLKTASKRRADYEGNFAEVNMLVSDSIALFYINFGRVYELWGKFSDQIVGHFLVGFVRVALPPDRICLIVATLSMSHQHKRISHI